MVEGAWLKGRIRAITGAGLKIPMKHHSSSGQNATKGYTVRRILYSVRCI